MKLTNLPLHPFAPGPTPSSVRARPGAVAALCGIIIQCDASSLLGDLFIRPAEALDLWFARVAHRGTKNGAGRLCLGMHAGLHVILEDGRHFVAEQLSGGWHECLLNGLHWTPLEEFQARERPEAGGWNVTVPPEKLRQVDEFAVKYAVAHLNSIKGRPFLREDCTGFIGRVFGPERRIFADSPTLRSLGIDLRSGEPALPLLDPYSTLDAEAEERLAAPVLRNLPDPAAESGTVSLRQLHHRLLIAVIACAAIGLLAPPGLFARRLKRH